jgi:hypothetical protein
MNGRTLSLLAAFALIGQIARAEELRFVCENWHPRLGQVNDFAFAVDLEQKTCDGQPCKVTDNELTWSSQGGRYETVVNRLSGEGYIYFSASSERTAVLKNCRTGKK